MKREKVNNSIVKSGLYAATGPIPYGMTNDYMFRIVFQQNKFALKGLLASLLNIAVEDISDLRIKNEIKIGEAISEKEYRMDILVEMNSSTSINIEMQIKNLGNWQYRSLAYLCREFDSLDHGDDYDDVKDVYQISFLDYTLFPNHPEFCAKYQMRNAKDNFLYADRFNLIVVELNHIEIATDDNISNGLSTWARLFKAKTWEELKMIANDNAYLESTAESMYLSNEDRVVRKICRERSDFLRSQAAKDRKIEVLSSENKSLSSEIKNMTSEISELKVILDKYKDKYGDLPV